MVGGGGPGRLEGYQDGYYVDKFPVVWDYFEETRVVENVSKYCTWIATGPKCFVLKFSMLSRLTVGKIFRFFIESRDSVGVKGGRVIVSEWILCLS